MERIALQQHDLAPALATLPVSTVARLLAPAGDMRDRASELIANEIVVRLQRSSAVDKNQMILPI